MRVLLKTVSKDDASAGCDPVGDAGGASSDVEPQFPELAVELPCVRLVQQGSVFGEESM
jgi:hypothetical protein